ncbi:hypothetical protein BHE90_013250 [Fusarium euwallaceae]|uniref:Uncharacterized protein n=4 Tax=Fusarium solani species complex TaxID=232080 RepID=A0A3M2RZV9_9HYPO|nr:hypothetical protein CDV36_009520 [Fusarium kuroshium]RSL79035.1 hypothetical protein CEP51_007701 [Fusarium floridanum]RSL96914.1 hypothetical protein CEP52_011163 [Fusarium oligoseptatum]RTE72344.1 hypothetical protein BHE90_013250 [Fusarium euwallaceae]
MQEGSELGRGIGATTITIWKPNAGLQRARVPAKRSSITLPIITGRQQTGKLDPCSAPRNPSPPSRQAPGFPSGADDSPPPFWLVLHHHFGAATEVVVDKVGPLTRTRFANLTGHLRTQPQALTRRYFRERSVHYFQRALAGFERRESHTP